MPVETAQLTADSGRAQDVVEYDEVFGEDTILRYTPTLEGFKEDIILKSRNTGNSFAFVVDAGGLQAVAENGVVFFVDPLSGEPAARMNPIYVYDSFTGERTEEEPHDSYDNQLLCEPLPDGCYRITIVADQAFLADPNTVYPVYVDPTVTVMGSGDIIDASLYSNYTWTVPPGSTESQMLKIGWSGSYGTGRALFTFPVLDVSQDLIHLYGNQITSAALHLYYEGGGSTYHTLSLYEFYSQWSEYSVKWRSTSPNNYGCRVSQANVGGSYGYKSFDITYVINKFKTNPDYTTAFQNRGTPAQG